MSYQVHNFQSGDVLLASQLNEMDNGIEELNNELAETNEEIFKIYPTEIAESTQGIVSFSNGAENIPVKKMNIAINCIQTGNGTPSSENVRPFLTFSGAKIENVKYNYLYWPKLDKTSITSNNSTMTALINEDGDLVISGINNSSSDFRPYDYQKANFINGEWGIFPAGTYTVIAKGLISNNPNDRIVFNAYYADGNTYFLSIRISSLLDEAPDGSGRKYTFTATKPFKAMPYISINPTIDPDNVINSTIKIIMVKDEDIIDDFNYSYPRLTEVSWANEVGNIGNGYLNVTTGELVVTHKFIPNYQGETLNGVWISSMDEYTSRTSPTLGAQVVYKLVNEEHYSITPVEFKTFLGINNILCNTGDISVIYRESNSKYSTITPSVKGALLEIFKNIYYIDDNDDYYKNLYNSFFPSSEIESVSVEFNQGGLLIFTTDDINILRKFITVTVTYINGQTEVLNKNDYLLEGVFYSGISYIVASYQGHGDAFPVIVSSTLPSYYRNNLQFQLDAIQYRNLGVYNDITDVSGNNVPVSFYTNISGYKFEKTFVSQQYRGEVMTDSSDLISLLSNHWTIEVTFQNRYYNSSNNYLPKNGGESKIASFVSGRGMILSNGQMQLPTSNTKIGFSYNLTDEIYTVSVTYDGTTLKEYIDGKNVYSENVTVDISNSNHLEFFGNGYSGNGPCSWNSVRVYSEALTQSRIGSNCGMDRYLYGLQNIPLLEEN